METLLIVVALLASFVIILTMGTGVYIEYRLQKKRIMEFAKIENRDIELLCDEREIDSKCDICFGRITENTVVECTCGKVFHKDCVVLTKECPYCKQVISEMKVRIARKKLCPVCNKDLGDESICDNCGHVLPRIDGVFKCWCGKEIHMKDAECKYCGAEFEPYLVYNYEGLEDDRKK